MNLRSQSHGPVVTWLIHFAAICISPLNAYLYQESQKYAAVGLENYLQQDLASAAVNYQEAIVLRPHDPTLQSALGQVYYGQGKVEEAEKQFRKALEYDYRNLRALKGLGILLQEKDDLVDAMYLYLRYLEVEPRDALVCYNLGATFHNLGDYESALNYYKRAEKEDPKDPLIKKNRALALLALGRSEEARDTLNDAQKLAPDDAEVNRLLGSALTANGELDRAKEFYDFALKQDPQDADGHLEFATLLVRLNRFAEAAEHAKAAAELFLKVRDTGRAGRAYWELGWDYYLMGDWESSLRASTEALQFELKLAPVYFNIGLALLQLGRDSEARKRYEDGLQNLAQLVDLKYYAIDDLRDALTKNPQLAGGAEILAMLDNKYNSDIAKSANQLIAQRRDIKVTSK
jgi:tetratricopeptide (TPR) repeat protein